MSTIVGWRGLMVELGLGQPTSRAFVAGTVAAGVCYLAAYPKAAFRDDGSMKPLASLSAAPDATDTHFLFVPAAVAVAAYVLT